MDTRKKHWLVALVVIVAFIVAKNTYVSKAVLYIFGLSYQDLSAGNRLILRYSSWLIPVVLAVLALNRFKFKSILTELGLVSNFKKGVVFAFLSTLPMLIGYAFLARFKLSTEMSFLPVLRQAILSGVMEEILFRGFLFGLLFRRAGWGFIPAVAINALFFATGHLYQSSDLAVSLGIFFLTLFGGSWFAWLYIEWDECLWLPIGLHFFMNLWWGVFSIDATALGGIAANILRVLTIIITIVVTVKRRKNMGGFKITKTNLIYNAK